MKTQLFALLCVSLCIALSAAAGAQTMQNQGFETPYHGSGNTLVANGWTAFRLQGLPTFLQSSGEKIEGATCQYLQGYGTQYHAGVYQRITGCAVGSRYRAAGWLLTVYDNAWETHEYWSHDGYMPKRLGVDPYGGTDPQSANVIWSWEEPMDRRWRRLMVDFTAQSTAVTVFGEIRNTGAQGYDIAWFEYFELHSSSYARISNVGVRPGATSAVITWTTDAVSDSKVRYWTWRTANEAEKNPIEVTGPSNVTQHSVNITGLISDKKYFYEVVSKKPGTSAANETIDGGRMFSTMSGTSFASIRDAKNRPDGTRVYVSDLIVSAGTNQLADSFFAQQQNRLNGIRVDKGVYSVPFGSVVCVSGTLATVNGERRLASPAVGIVSLGQ